MGSTKGTLAGERQGVGHKNKRQRKEGIFICFQSDADSEQHIKPLWPRLSWLNDAGERSSMAVRNAASSSYNLSVIWNKTDVCVLY